jgi:hypothetical protein
MSSTTGGFMDGSSLHNFNAEQSVQSKEKIDDDNNGFNNIHHLNTK